MHGPALLCSLPVALVGAYYLVNAGSVHWLGGLEGQQANRVRVQLRRTNGIVMLVLGVALYLGVARVFGREPGQPVGTVGAFAWLAVLPLLLAMLVLAWLDMRLTRKLKRDIFRKAAMMKQNDQTSFNTPAGGACRGLAVVLAALLAVGAGLACDDTAASSQTRPTTGPSTSPALREADQPRRGEQDPQQLRQVEMKIGDKTFVMQVADTEAERQLGLMYRKSLDENEGMLFIYPEEQLQSFWMKNTFVPLDIAYATKDGRVLNIEQMAAHDLNGSDSIAPAKYVIELPLGAAEKAKLKPGMTVKIPENARDAAD